MGRKMCISNLDRERGGKEAGLITELNRKDYNLFQVVGTNGKCASDSIS